MTSALDWLFCSCMAFPSLQDQVDPYPLQRLIVVGLAIKPTRSECLSAIQPKRKTPNRKSTRRSWIALTIPQHRFLLHRSQIVVATVVVESNWLIHGTLAHSQRCLARQRFPCFLDSAAGRLMVCVYLNLIAASVLR